MVEAQPRAPKTPKRHFSRFTTTLFRVFDAQPRASKTPKRHFWCVFDAFGALKHVMQLDLEPPKQQKSTFYSPKTPSCWRPTALKSIFTQVEPGELGHKLAGHVQMSKCQCSNVIVVAPLIQLGGQKSGVNVQICTSSRVICSNASQMPAVCPNILPMCVMP